MHTLDTVTPDRVTKDLLINFSVKEIIISQKIPFKFFNTLSNFMGVTAAELRWHLSNMICDIQ